jgi:hypothetical protein
MNQCVGWYPSFHISRIGRNSPRPQCKGRLSLVFGQNFREGQCRVGRVGPELLSFPAKGLSDRPEGPRMQSCGCQHIVQLHHFV